MIRIISVKQRYNRNIDDNISSLCLTIYG